jgi:hypothetical protein
VVEIGRETTVGHGIGPSRPAEKKLGGETTRCHGAGQSHQVEFKEETSVYPRARMVLISLEKRGGD